jgi:ribosomal protein L19
MRSWDMTLSLVDGCRLGCTGMRLFVESFLKMRSESEPKWRFIERTVAVLEQMLAAGALVQDNQREPELVTGTLRQCDVTIRYGSPPRSTLAAIVEVQDRSSKVDLPTFEGWCAKREKLGAQRLICVAREGYSEGVEKAAASMGDIVILMTLCEPEQRPIFIAETPVFLHAEIVHNRQAEVVLDREAPAFVCSCDDKLFESPLSEENLDLYSLAERALVDGTAKDVRRRNILSDRFEKTFRVEFSTAGKPLILKRGERMHSVLEVRFCDLVEEFQQVLTSTPLAYEQRNINGALGWVLFSRGTYRGEEFYTQQSFLKLSDGTAQVGPVTISKMSGVAQLSLSTEIMI